MKPITDVWFTLRTGWIEITSLGVVLEKVKNAHVVRVTSVSNVFGMKGMRRELHYQLDKAIDKVMKGEK